VTDVSVSPCEIRNWFYFRLLIASYTTAMSENEDVKPDTSKITISVMHEKSVQTFKIKRTKGIGKVLNIFAVRSDICCCQHVSQTLIIQERMRMDRSKPLLFDHCTVALIVCFFNRCLEVHFPRSDRTRNRRRDARKCERL
jgi:hypothetical protein